MNKLFIGLLIVAAAAGIFFLLRKKEILSSEKIDRSLLIGRWAAAGDSVATPLVYEFLDNEILVCHTGSITETSDSAAMQQDTVRYEWKASNTILWKNGKEESHSKEIHLLRLTQDSLSGQLADSSTIVLLRVK